MKSQWSETSSPGCGCTMDRSPSRQRTVRGAQSPRLRVRSVQTCGCACTSVEHVQRLVDDAAAQESEPGADGEGVEVAPPLPLLDLGREHLRSESEVDGRRRCVGCELEA